MLLFHVLFALCSDSTCSSELSITAEKVTPISNSYEYLSSVFMYVTDLLKLYGCEKDPNTLTHLNFTLQKNFYNGKQFINQKRIDQYTSALKNKDFTECYYLIEDDLHEKTCEHHRKCNQKCGTMEVNYGYRAWLSHFTIQQNNDMMVLKLKKSFKGGSRCIVIVDNFGMVKRFEISFLCQNVILPIYVMNSSTLLDATVRMDTHLFAYLLQLVKIEDKNGKTCEKTLQEIKVIWKLFEKSISSKRVGVLLHAKLAIYNLLSYIFCGGDSKRLLCTLKEILNEGYTGSAYGGSKYDKAILYVFGPIEIY
ncbi:hypothetical protein BDAP_002356 [Binucleata daphniae]